MAEKSLQRDCQDGQESVEVEDVQKSLMINGKEQLLHLHNK